MLVIESDSSYTNIQYLIGLIRFREKMANDIRLKSLQDIVTCFTGSQKFSEKIVPCFIMETFALVSVPPEKCFFKILETFGIFHLQ